MATRLMIEGHGDVELEVLVDFLANLNAAYVSVFTFEQTLSRLERVIFDLDRADTLFSRRGRRFSPFWATDLLERKLQVPIANRLRLARVELTSPGFWEVVGSLNPLEVLRQYLSDRHTRRQDRGYRESAESRRLELENLLLENQVLRERIEIARMLGVSDSEIAALVRQLVEEPLTQLGAYQDRGVIDSATIKTDEPEPER